MSTDQQQPSFSPHTLKDVLPSLQKQAISIVDAAAAKQECDVMADIAIPNPSQVFLTLFGLPLKVRDCLIAGNHERRRMSTYVLVQRMLPLRILTASSVCTMRWTRPGNLQFPPIGVS